MIELLVSGDDRTGTLETGGACADLGYRVRLTATPDDTDECVVIDIDSRHCTPAQAADRIIEAHSLPAQHRCHKMDSGLRGNWAHEIVALAGAGRKIGMLASFPDAGRRCEDGVVYIHDVPVADSPFGTDPRNPLTSSRPEDYLRDAGCGPALDDGSVAILDANDNDQLREQALRCRREDRMLVGTTGGIGAYVATLRESSGRMPLPPLPRPALIVCGSLHPVSRQQIDKLTCLQLPPDRAEDAAAVLDNRNDVVIRSEMPKQTVTGSAAERMAATMAQVTWKTLEQTGAPTLIILGGDTAAAILGNRVLRVLGSLDTAVALCRTDDRRQTVVTKGGGIGDVDMVRRMLA